MIIAVIISIVLLLAPFLASTPDEALWSPILSGVVLLAAAWQLLRRRVQPVSRPATLLFAGAAAWAVLSMLWEWLRVNRGAPVYFDAMLRTLGYWLAGYALVVGFGGVPAKRPAAYCTILALVLGATVASYVGLQDYLIHVAAHQASWREFGTSSPDYFAAFLVMTIPVTLALFIGAPSRGSLTAPLAFGMALLPQLLVLPTTGSRFALISVSVGMAVMLAAGFAARKGGLELTASSRSRVMALVVVALLASVVVAKPILHRLGSSVAADQAHSGQFRVWTWRGALHLAEAHPIFGAGPGTFVYTYQRFALVGFTRLAHNSFLQAGAETGFPGLALLIAGFAAVIVAGWRSLGRVETESASVAAQAAVSPKAGRKRQPQVTAPTTGKADLLSYVAGANDKLLMCGLIAGVVAGLVQNAIDSDWYVTFNGFTLWFLAGAVLVFASRFVDAPQEDSAPGGAKLAIAAAVVAAILGIAMVVWGVSEGYAASGKALVTSGGSAADASKAYHTAVALDPLRAESWSALGYMVDPIVDPAACETDLRKAVALAPDGVNYRRLGKMLAASQRPADVVAAMYEGLKYEPNNVELWNLLAEARLDLGDPAAARDAYLKVASIEDSLIGRVLAVTEVTNLNYAEADIYLGDTGSEADKLTYYARAEATLRAYAGEGGSKNMMRMSQSGGRADSAADTNRRDQYDHASAGLIAALSQAHDPQARAVSEERTETLAAFDKLIAPTPAQ